MNASGEPGAAVGEPGGSSPRRGASPPCVGSSPFRGDEPPGSLRNAAARLRAETFARTVEVHAELGSTNDRALALAADPPPLPAVILADRQTAGRGRGSHRWAAPAGALTFTLLLEPPGGRVEGTPRDVSPLAPLTGLVVAELAATLTPHEVGVKWPNDVLLRDSPGARWGKLAGVLCEAPRPGLVAVGVGWNVNCDPADFPAGLPIASLRTPAGPHDRVGVLVELLVRLEAAFAAFADDPRLDADRWAARDALAGRAVTVRAGGSVVRGTACGIAPDGALRVFDGTAVRAVRSGTVETW